MMGIFNVYNLMASIAAVHITTQKPLNEICEALIRTKDNFISHCVNLKNVVLRENVLESIDYSVNINNNSNQNKNMKISKEDLNNVQYNKLNNCSYIDQSVKNETLFGQRGIKIELENL